MTTKDTKERSWTNWAKNRILLVIIIFLTGLAVGFYFGYEIGFEKAAKILTN